MASSVDDAASTVPGSASCSMRDAKFTVSPSAVKSMWRSSLIDPTTTGPVLRPMRNSISPPKSRARWSRISSEARAACTPEFSTATGAPNSAMTPSPRNWVTVPSWRCTASVMMRRQSCAKRYTSSSSRASEAEVKPTASANNTVTTRRSPASSSRTRRTCSRRCGATNSGSAAADVAGESPPLSAISAAASAFEGSTLSARSARSATAAQSPALTASSACSSNRSIVLATRSLTTVRVCHGRLAAV